MPTRSKTMARRIKVSSPCHPSRETPGAKIPPQIAPANVTKAMYTATLRRSGLACLSGTVAGSCFSSASSMWDTASPSWGRSLGSENLFAVMFPRRHRGVSILLSADSANRRIGRGLGCLLQGRQELLTELAKEALVGLADARLRKPQPL